MHGPGDVGFFDRVAPLYDRLAPRPEVEPIRRGLDRADRPVERVLDLAGGSGRVARELDGAVVVDAALGMLRRAAGHGVETVAGDAGRLPVRDAAVDAVVVVDALHHLPDQRAAVEEAFRVLRPGGVLVVREFDPTTVAGRALVLGERLLRFDSLFTPPADLAAFLGEAGFDAEGLETGFEYTVVGTKREGL